MHMGAGVFAGLCGAGVCVHMGAGVLAGQKKALDFLGAGITGSCELLGVHAGN